MYRKFNQENRDFGSDRNSGGKRHFSRPYGDRPNFTGGNGTGKPLFSTHCSDCGDFCEVPFKPVNGRPVFCRDCFKRQDQDGFEPRRFEQKAPRFSPAPAPESKMSNEQFKTLNAKMDKILEILEAAMEEEFDFDETEEDFLVEEEMPEEMAPEPAAPKKKLTRGQTKRAKRTGKTV